MRRCCYTTLRRQPGRLEIAMIAKNYGLPRSRTQEDQHVKSRRESEADVVMRTNVKSNTQEVCPFSAHAFA